MDSSPLVSVVIVNYNYDNFVGAAIQSALSQDYEHSEVIVVDDASTDQSREIIESFGSAVRTCYHDVNRGHAAAMNTGFLAAKGRIICFLDSDDSYYRFALRRFVGAYRQGVAQIQGRLDIIDASGTITGMHPQREQPLDEGDVTQKLLAYNRYNNTITSGLAFAKSALDSIMPIPELEFRRAGDGYLSATAPFYGIVSVINSSVGAYRRHPSNHSSFKQSLIEGAAWRIEHNVHRKRVIDHHAKRTGRRSEFGSLFNDPLYLEDYLILNLHNASPSTSKHVSRRRLFIRANASLVSLRLPAIQLLSTRLFWAAMAFLPKRTALKLVVWKNYPQQRPRSIDMAAKMLRSLVRLSTAVSHPSK